MRTYGIIFLLTLLLVGCKKEAEKPKVIYDTPQKTITKTVDTSKVLVADLPIHMEGTSVLMFPVGDLNFYKRLGSGYAKGNSVSYTMSNYGEYEITGYLNDIKFQPIGKDTIYSLTDKSIIIQSFTYLKDHAAKSRQQLLVYVINDMDTNQDNKLDENDIKALYVSSIDGKNFTKLSVDYQELLDWKYSAVNNSLYFRTVEDTNKNGEMDSQDKVHYFVINLMTSELKAEEFNPVK